MHDAAERSPVLPSRRKRLLRGVRRLSFLLALIYLAVLIVIFAIQNRLIFAGHATQGSPQAQVQPSSEFELLHLKTAGGTPIGAIFGRALDADDQPLESSAGVATIIYFYGNAMCVADSFAEFHRFRRLGCNVLIPDFAGYGMSGGRPSEAGCYATADAAYAYLNQRSDVDPRRIVAAGWSLGAAVAIDLASRKPVAGLLAISGFSSMGDMARLVFPWAPTSLLLRSRFESERKIKLIDAPIFLIHGESDSIVPFVMRDRLASAARTAGRSVETMTVNSDHLNVFEAGGGRMDAAIAAFFGGASRSDTR